MKSLLKKVAIGFLPDSLLQKLKKIHYARKLRAISENDEPDLKVVKLLVGPGDCAVDIGANIGVYTRCLSESAGRSGQVYSVEPVDLTFDVLRSNVRKLKLENVALINAAISDSDGTVTMEVPHYESGGENFYEARITTAGSGGNLRRLTVPKRSVDSLFAEMPRRISLVKCDVEGHELNCIRGAARVIEKWHPAWLIEIGQDPDTPGTSARQVFDELARSGYQAWWFDGAFLRKRAAGDSSSNYFFLTADHLRIVQTKGFPVRE